MRSANDQSGEVTLRFHGTGAGHPSAERLGSGATLESAGRPLLLVDAGDSIPRGLLRDDVDPNSIGDLLLSHLHPDHWSGIPGLVMAWDICGRTEPARLWLPPGAGPCVESVLRNSWLQARPRNYRLVLSEYTTDLEFTTSGYRITPGRTSHLDLYVEAADQGGHSFPSHSFLVRVDGASILFTQDLGSEEDISTLLPKATHLVAEVSHVDLDRLLEMTSGAHIEQVFLTHVPPSAESELEDRFGNGSSNESAGVIVAYDGMKASIRPSGVHIVE